ncbi:type IV secretion system protein TraC [Entomohabitans teleogrylli]|uniref:type IV secretion system protein TraC n=1 Tax=Entomohabitans teleogrylli TaxID=1384589 RepID=UPI00073D1F8A|nr:type IV secretion system protein TraC [Entomohabitans teleogrylli]
MAFMDEMLRRLMTDWRRPEGAAKAGDMLEDMDYPSFVSLLPYRHFDSESGLFVNDKTVGFILECTPLIGGNEQIVDALDNFLRNKLPRQKPLSFLLLGSKCISDMLDHGLADFSWQGEMAEKFNAITRAYYEQGALSGLANRKGYPLSLRNYRLFISYAEEHKRVDEAVVQSLSQTLSVVQQSLYSASMNADVLSKAGLIGLVRELVNFRHDQITSPPDDTDPYEELNTQCAERAINLKVEPDSIRQSLANRDGTRSATRIMNFMLEKNPEQFCLWQGGNNLSNLLDPASSVPCPFAITLTVEVDEQAKSQNEAVRKFATNDKRANSAFAKWVPGVKDAAREWGDLRSRLSKGQSALARYSFGITLFCEDDDETALMSELALNNTFNANGLALAPPTFMQMRNYLSLFPFMMQEGLWGDMRRSGATLRAEAFNVANLLPVVADNRISPAGLPIPSYRNQLSFLNLFDTTSGLGNDNYNLAVCGTSGGGKSFLMQAIIRQILDSGGRSWVFDMGDSYKGLCANVGGVYVDATELKFNPFAGIVDIVESAESIRDLLLVLANPSGGMDDTSKSILLNAVQGVWEGQSPSGRSGNNALIDDVVLLLQHWIKSAVFQDADTVRHRMEEIVVSLEKYTTNGLYGEYFNSPEPALDDSVRFCVLEMGKLKNKPDLLAAIMFSMMIYVEQRMYLSPRSERKAAIIDEAWKLLASENSFIGDFIENGYRTARKYGGAYITITQGIEDFDGEKASLAARAAWSNSSFKIILRQNLEAFRKYNKTNEGQFNPVEQAVIEGFPSAKDSHFSAFMLRVGGQISYHRLLLDPLSRVMFSSDGEDFEFRERCLKQGISLQETLLKLAHHKFPREMEKLEQWKVQTRH